MAGVLPHGSYIMRLMPVLLYIMILLPLPGWAATGLEDEQDYSNETVMLASTASNAQLQMELKAKETWDDIKAVKWLKRTVGERLNIDGYAKNETALRINSPSAFTKILNIVQLEPRMYFNSFASLYLRVYSYGDLVYNLEGIDTVSVRKGPRNILGSALTPDEVDALHLDNVRNVKKDNSGIVTKEIYVDLSLSNMDLRIGKQIVRWGVVEGARVTDELNPLDFSEMILRSVDDRYIPLNMVKTDMYAGNYTLELIYIPELTFHKPAPPGSGWEQFQLFEGLEKPEENLKNSEYAIKLSLDTGRVYMGATYFYSWDDFPTSFREIIGLGQFGVSPTIVFAQRYTRVKMLGFAITSTVSESILNAEIAYVTGKYFGTKFGDLTGDPEISVNPIIAGGAIKSRYLKYALGWDFLFFGADTSFQMIQQLIPSYNDALIPEKVETIWAFSTRKKIYYDMVFPSLLVLYFENDQDILFRPRVDFSVWNNLLVSAGADIFSGNISNATDNTIRVGEFHFVGFFDNNDRVYMEVKYIF